MARLALQLLGPVAISYDGRPLDHFRTKAVQALLVYLVCRPEVHRRESLMALLWPEANQASAQNNLRQALYHLRKAVPEVSSNPSAEPVPFILADHQVVQVNPQAAFDLDTAVFQRLLNDHHAHWPEAVNLYRGDFLCDFYLPQSAPFEAWVLACRADVRSQALGALDTLAAKHMARGALETAAQFARQQLAIDDLHESGHRRLLEILLRLGQRSQALAHYDAYCRHLAETLGIGPSAECVRLVEQVKNAATAPSLAAAAESSPHPDLPHNIPPPLNRLIGRDDELRELDSLAATSECRLINLVGTGGIGKTRLALAYARRLLRRCRRAGSGYLADGIYVVFLQPLTDRAVMIAAIAAALNLPLDEEERRSPLQQLLDFLRDKRLLLILDNFEHLLQEAALLPEMLAAAPGLHLLVTSRERLDLYREQTFYVQGLDLPQEAGAPDAESISAYAAAELFLERARHLRPDYALPAREVAYLAELCRLVCGIPLALELAATWIDVFSLEEMVAEIGHNLDFLSAAYRDVPARHHSMRAVFDSAWSRLSAAEQAALAALAVFRGDFCLAAAAAVTQAGHQVMASLLRKSMLQVNAQNGRFQMHELLRQYSADKLRGSLSASGEDASLSAAQHRHSAYYCQALAAWESDLQGERQLEATQAITADLDNIGAAWEWAAANAQTALLQQAVEALALYCEHSGRHHLGEQLCGLAAACAKAQLAPAHGGSNDVRFLIARLLARQARFRGLSQGPPLPQDLARESLDILHVLQDQGRECRKELAFSYRILAISVAQVGHSGQALDIAKRSLELSQAIEDEWQTAYTLDVLGTLAFRTGDWIQGRRWLEDSLALQRKLGNRAGEASALIYLAIYAGHAGETAQCERYERASLAIHEALGNQRQVAVLKRNLAVTLSELGRFQDSAVLLLENLATVRHLGYGALAMSVNVVYATVLEHLGQYDEAAAVACSHLPQGRELEDITTTRIRLRLMGTLSLARRQYGEAKKWLGQYHKVCLEQNAPLADLLGSLFLAYVPAGTHAQAAAARQLRADLQRGLAACFVRSVRWGVPAGALLLARNGQLAEAAAVYAAALGEPFIANSRWFDDVAGAPLRGLTQALPPAARQAAEEQGREWDIWQAAAILVEQLAALAGN